MRRRGGVKEEGEMWERFVLPDPTWTLPGPKLPEERLVCAETQRCEMAFGVNVTGKE